SVLERINWIYNFTVYDCETSATNNRQTRISFIGKVTSLIDDNPIFLLIILINPASQTVCISSWPFHAVGPGLRYYFGGRKLYRFIDLLFCKEAYLSLIAHFNKFIK